MKWRRATSGKPQTTSKLCAIHSWILYFLSSLVVACRYNNIHVDFVIVMVKIVNIEYSKLEIDGFKRLYVYN